MNERETSRPSNKVTTRRPEARGSENTGSTRARSPDATKCATGDHNWSELLASLEIFSEDFMAERDAPVAHESRDSL